MTQKILFIDRDGVINKDSPEYIKSWSEFEFLPRSLDAIRLLTQQGFDVILITNQSAIHRHLVSKKNLEYMHANMISVIEEYGGKLKDIFYCPHIPDDQCKCRKPKPGLIMQAQQKYRIDVKKTMMIGDSLKDMECARNAGCGGSILVRTGNGKVAEQALKEKNIVPTYVLDDLYEAALIITRPGLTVYSGKNIVQS